LYVKIGVGNGVGGGGIQRNGVGRGGYRGMGKLGRNEKDFLY